MRRVGQGLERPATQADHLPTGITGSHFEATITVATRATLHTAVFRRTSTVLGTAIDVELLAATGVRVPIDLPVGLYDVICHSPGHET